MAARRSHRARRTPTRVAPKLDSFKSAIAAVLIDGLPAPRKQRHAAKRIFAWLVDEHDARDLSYWAVRTGREGPITAGPLRLRSG